MSKRRRPARPWRMRAKRSAGEARSAAGPCFSRRLPPCPRGWRHPGGLQVRGWVLPACHQAARRRRAAVQQRVRPLLMAARALVVGEPQLGAFQLRPSGRPGLTSSSVASVKRRPPWSRSPEPCFETHVQPPARPQRPPQPGQRLRHLGQGTCKRLAQHQIAS